MCPLVIELKKRECFDVTVCLSGQHREMLDEVMNAFGVGADFDLNIMQSNQSLTHITSKILCSLEEIFKIAYPDIVLVHGDTSTAFAAALACFYGKIPVAHIEAGLRTGDIFNPYPEEFNRKAIALSARLHFAPTPKARDNLLCEGIAPSDIFVVGNTAIDALKTTVRSNYSHPLLEMTEGTRRVLLTAHRRESVGDPMHQMLRAVRQVIQEHKDISVIYPVHKNPTVRKCAEEELGGCERIYLTEPLGVLDFHNIMARSILVLTDSGGIQEEAPALGKPVLVMRETTERPEGVEAGTLKLVGCRENEIYKGFKLLLTSREEYGKMAQAHNPYGNGNSSSAIADILTKLLF